MTGRFTVDGDVGVTDGRSVAVNIYLGITLLELGGHGSCKGVESQEGGGEEVSGEHGGSW